MLCATTCTTPAHQAFVQALGELGHVEGRTIVIEWRPAEGHFDRLPNLAGELARLKVDVIAASSDPSALAAKKEVTAIPVVFIGVGGDPVERGLVASLARPGGNVTGVALQLAELVPKHLQLLKEMVPSLSRVAVLRDPSASALIMKLLDDAAARVRVQLDVVDVRGREDVPSALSTLGRRSPGALLLLPNPTAGSWPTDLTSRSPIGARLRMSTASSRELGRPICRWSSRRSSF